MSATKATRKSASLIVSLAIVIMTVALSLQGTAFCVGADGSVSLSASGSQCHCAMHGHDGTACSHSHGKSSALGAGCSCTDFSFQLSPAVIDSSFRTQLKAGAVGGNPGALTALMWIEPEGRLMSGSQGFISGGNPILLRLQSTVLLI